MTGFSTLLRQNRNYRYTWIGQVISEIGDHFNNVAVFSLVLDTTQSGLVVSGVMLSRAIPAMLVGPLAGVALDRLDRKRVMIASDLIRAVVAACFILTIGRRDTWLLYLLSGLLMVASPFFTAGRSSILPVITTEEELHTANSLTQTTGWINLTIGTMLGGVSVAAFGYRMAFLGNAGSFVISALCISRLFLKGRGFRAPRRSLTETEVVRPWRDYMDGLRYLRQHPLILGICLVGVGWATGGGAAQILFSVFGDLVFHRGPEGIGFIWSAAGIGLLCGAMVAYQLGPRLSFEAYKRTIVVCYVIHGGAYIVFSQMRSFGWALVFIGLSRAAVGISSILNTSQLLRHVSDSYRGRVFSTNESMQWSVMMISMMLAGIGTQSWSPRTIGAIAGALSSTTAIFWGWMNATGRLPEPAREGVEPDEIEIHGEPTI